MADVRMLECLASAMGLLAKGGDSEFRQHKQALLKLIRDDQG